MLMRDLEIRQVSKAILHLSKILVHKLKKLPFMQNV